MKASETLDPGSHPLIEAVASRDRLAAIDAMSDFLAERLVGAKAYEAARIVAQIEALAKTRADLTSGQTKATVADDLAAARKRRRAEAASTASAGGQSN